MVNSFAYPPIITGILMLSLGISVARKSTTFVSKIYSLLCLTTFVWLVSYGIAYLLQNDCALLRNLFRAGYAGIIFIPILWFHFVVSFLNEAKFRKVVYISYFFGFCYLTLLFFTDSFITGYKKYFWGFYPISVNSYWHLSFLCFYSSLWLFCLILLFTRRIRAKGLLEKRRMTYLLWSFAIVLPGVIDFVPNYGLELYPFAWLFVGGCIIVTAYAIIKYRLMDIRLVFTRTGVFIFTYSFVLGFPFIVVFAYQQSLINTFGSNWWMVPLILSIILATVGPFAYLYINRQAEDKLMREQRSYQHVLKGASSGMIRIKNLGRLLDLIVRVVAKTVKISHASVYLYDEERKSYKLSASRGLNLKSVSTGDILAIDSGSPLVWALASRRGPVVHEEEIMRLNDDPSNKGLLKLADQLKDLRAALVVPSFVEKRLIGILVLGEKRSGKMYSQDDLNVFLVLANQAALAIENAQFYEEIKNTHQQLFQAEKLATIGTMADGLSHQINNRFHALSLIAGDALDILKTGNFSSCDEKGKADLADVKSALERIEANVIQGGEVVKGLLKYSRPGDGGFEMVDLKDVLNGAIDMVQFKIKLKEIDLIQSLPEGTPKIYANTIQLQEVFFNLIDNAYDATRERQAVLKEEGFRGKIEISAFGHEDYLVVNIVDNGMGIKEVDKKKLFTPFFTTKATAKKGTGLGLYVIERIIAAHRGKIDIQSVHEQGTTFMISLPTRPKPVT